MGLLSTPLATFASLLSESSAFQSWTEADDATAAAEFIFADVAGPGDPLPRAIVENASRSVSKLASNRAVPFFGNQNILRVDFEAASGLEPDATAAEERAARASFRASLDAILAQVEDFIGDCFEVEAVSAQGPIVFGAEEETDGADMAARTLLQTVDIRWRDD